MNKKTSKYLKMFIDYIRRTFKNKLCAILMLIVGMLTANVSGDSTFLILMLLIGVPLFFANKDWFC